MSITLSVQGTADIKRSLLYGDWWVMVWGSLMAHYDIRKQLKCQEKASLNGYFIPLYYMTGNITNIHWFLPVSYCNILKICSVCHILCSFISVEFYLYKTFKNRLVDLDKKWISQRPECQEKKITSLVGIWKKGKEIKMSPLRVTVLLPSVK